MATTPHTEFAPPHFSGVRAESAIAFEQFLKAGEGNGRFFSSGARLVALDRWTRALYVLTDLSFVCLNATVVLTIRYLSPAVLDEVWARPGVLERFLPLESYGAFVLLYAAVVVLSCTSQNLYRRLDYSKGWDESWRVAKAVLLATLMLAVFIYLSGHKDISRLWVGCTALLNTLTLIGWRKSLRSTLKRRVAHGIGARNALIVGAGKIGQALARHMEMNQQLGYLCKGFLDQNHTGDPRMLGKIEDLAQVARAHFIDDIFVTIPSEREIVKSIAFVARMNRLSVKVLPEFYDGLAWNVPMEHIGDFPVCVLHREPIPTLGLFFKRTMDIVFAALGLVVLAPACVWIALALKRDSEGPVFYRASRVGRKGRRFVCYKFRTMVVGADEQKKELSHLNERRGPFFKISDDPRVTSLGRVLRRYSLDEIPQLWNVLKGDMSLVGPRPHPLDDYQRYRLEHLRRLDVKPGLTGLWQVSARNHPSFERSVYFDNHYIENWNLLLDLRILLKTIPAVLRGEGQ